jgi:polysaccharide export outer membrane protein
MELNFTRASIRRPVAGLSAILVAVIGLGGLLSACASSTGAGAISVDLFKDEPDPAMGEYVINVGDVLNVQVWEQDKMGGRMRVRNDGRITLPFVNDIDAAGKTPTKLASDLETALKTVILIPKVTISIEESKPLTISVLGEVSKPGSQNFEVNAGVAQALAAAGGLTPFAHKNRIFVVRAHPKPVRVQFNYTDLMRSLGRAAEFRLKPGDVVLVE